MGKIFGYIKMAFIGIFVLGIIGALFLDDEGEEERLVDLDVVLDTMVSTLDGLDSGQAGSGTATVTPVEEDSSKSGAFLSAYHTNINNTSMIPTPIGVTIDEKGSILGFDDEDGNNEQAGSEGNLFRVEIDAENSRLVATDLENGYHSDRGFRVGGLMAGYLLGRMLSGQRTAGISSNKFSKMKMQPRGYAEGIKASRRASAKRSRGSRSFSTGK